MKFNEEEILVQHREELINSGEYVALDVVIGCNDSIPYISLAAKKYSDYEIAQLIKVLEKQIEVLKNIFPNAVKLLSSIKLNMMGSLETKGNKER